MSHFLIGKLTAVENTAIAMTVTDAFDYTPKDGSDEEETTTVTAIYIANGAVQSVQLDSNHFVGFGDYLIYENGVFTAAGSHEDELDDDDDTGPTDDEERYAHTPLRCQ